MKLVSGFHETEDYRCLGNLNSDSVDLRLIYCGHENCKEGHRVGPNKRSAYLIHVILQGKGRLETEGRVFDMKAGDAFGLRPGQEAWYEADLAEPWSYVWVGFLGMKAEECFLNSGFYRGRPVVHGLNTGLLSECVSHMLEARELSYGDNLRRGACLNLFMAELIDKYAKQIPAYDKVEKTPGAEQVKYLMTYMADHYKSQIRVSDLAEKMGVNRSYLSNSFRKITGYSPTAYLTMIRMEKAKSLLDKTNLAVNQVAVEVGYTDPLNFSRVFKRYYGESPKQYRKELEQMEIMNERSQLPEIFL